MSSDPTTGEPKLQCPACRANQPLQATCRRCGADLQLLVMAKRHVAALIQRRAAATRSGNQELAQEISRELRMMQPRA